MTWDWDKLQEKRQRQQGQRPSRPLFGDDDNDTQDEQPRRARRSPSGNGGDGNGFDGRNALKGSDTCFPPCLQMTAQLIGLKNGRTASRRFVRMQCRL